MRCATRTMLALIAAVSLLATGVATQQTESAEALLRRAMDTAIVDGDLDGAITQYQTIVDTFTADRGVVATALVRMAECYEKLGAPGAQEAYQRVLCGITRTSGTQVGAALGPGWLRSRKLRLTHPHEGWSRGARPSPPVGN